MTGSAGPSYTPLTASLLRPQPEQDLIAIEYSKPFPTGRLLGLDWGEARIGVALTDELQITTRPLPVVIRKNWKAVLASIAEVVDQFDVKGVVLGLPLKLDGTEGDAAANIRRIAWNLHLSLGIPVFLHNESLTSVEASQRLAAKGIDFRESKNFLDSEAACVILEDFLGSSAPSESQYNNETE